MAGSPTVSMPLVEGDAVPGSISRIVMTCAVALSVGCRRGQPESTLRLSGNIEAHESLVAFKVAGRIVALPVREGQKVAAGTLLARLDDTDYRAQVQLDEAAVRVREAELALARAGGRREEIGAANAVVRDAEADLQQKATDFQRYDYLYRERAVPPQMRENALTALRRARANYDRARQQRRETVAGARKEQIAISRSQVEQARAALEASRIRLGYTTLTAPTAGVVLVRQAEVGEVVAPGTPVVTIADLDHLWMRGYISETDLGRVRWGQAATITSDTFPDRRYRGRVSFISSEAEFTPKSIETHRERVMLVYRVKIDVENPRHELKPGMPVDAVIELAPAR